ncbi:MAG: hypothetical protein QW735_03120 [archaeon]
MGLSSCKSSRAFFFSITVFFAILTLFSLILLANTKPSNTPYATVDSFFLESVNQDFLNILNLKVIPSPGKIQDVYWPNKAQQTYARLMKQAQFLENFGIIADYSQLQNGFSLTRDLNYSWSGPILVVQGTFTQVNISYNSTANFSSNCLSSGGQVNISFFSTNNNLSISPQTACNVSIIFPTSNLSFSFIPPRTLIFNFTNVNFLIAQNMTFNTALNLRFSGEKFEFSNFTTTSPGWIEPDYPPKAAPLKYYGSNQYGNFIIIDRDSDLKYDSFYYSNSTNFSESPLRVQESKMFLNKTLFLINVDKQYLSLEKIPGWVFNKSTSITYYDSKVN